LAYPYYYGYPYAPPAYDYYGSSLPPRGAAVLLRRSARLLSPGDAVLFGLADGAAGAPSAPPRRA